MAKKRGVIAGVLFVVMLSLFGSVGGSCVTEGIATNETKSSSFVQLYKDKNGFFAALPPNGWKQQDYPAETVRSKVAFLHPTEKEVLIRIIASPLGNTGLTINDVYQDLKQSTDKELRSKYPNGVFNITRGTMGAYETIVQRSSVPDLLEHEVVVIVSKQVSYTVAFGATTKVQFDRYYPAFQKFLQDFCVLELEREVTREEANAASVANKKRLAELYEKLGRVDEALKLVQEGLILDPSNVDLKAMEKQLLLKSSTGK